MTGYKGNRPRRRRRRVPYWAAKLMIMGLALVGLWGLKTLGPLKPTAPQALQESKFYRNCAAARAAGVAPIYAGQPGYRDELDADSDGIACEPYRPR